MLVPLTVALKVCCAPVFNCTLLGDTATDTCPGAAMVTRVEPDNVGFVREVAVTATVAGLGAFAGAV